MQTRFLVISDCEISSVTLIFKQRCILFSASSVPNKDCTETIQKKSGWITAPDNDADGLYDFNLNCVWIVEVDITMRIRYWFTYIGLDVEYQYGTSCSTDYIEVSFGNK